MEKENVLEIEYQEVFDKLAVRIKYQNFEVLKRGEFEDRGIGVVSFNNPCYLSYPYNQLHLKGKFKIDDDFIFTVTKEEFENIKNMVEKINEKYGIKKRWRAENGKFYYYIDSVLDISISKEGHYNLDNVCYERGNYFRTKEEAEEYQEYMKQCSLEWHEKRENNG